LREIEEFKEPGQFLIDVVDRADKGYGAQRKALMLRGEVQDV
jgi:hypothetical protein